METRIPRSILVHDLLDIDKDLNFNGKKIMDQN